MVGLLGGKEGFPWTAPLSVGTSLYFLPMLRIRAEEGEGVPQQERKEWEADESKGSARSDVVGL